RDARTFEPIAGGIQVRSGGRREVKWRGHVDGPVVGVVRTREVDRRREVHDSLKDSVCRRERLLLPLADVVAGLAVQIEIGVGAGPRDRGHSENPDDERDDAEADPPQLHVTPPLLTMHESRVPTRSICSPWMMSTFRGPTIGGATSTCL